MWLSLCILFWTQWKRTLEQRKILMSKVWNISSRSDGKCESFRLNGLNHAKPLALIQYLSTRLYIELYVFLFVCFFFQLCCMSLTLCPPDYPVLSFDGKKKVVLSNVSWMGGKNEFLGIAYLVIGSLCVVMSIVMLIVYAKFKFPEEEWGSGNVVGYEVYLPCEHFVLFFCFL